MNDNREIVGGYRLGSTTYYNTLYTPVPEPSEFAVMGVGIVGLLLARRRKKRSR
ncbi:MAG: PEP-CTERM sorting domain-containing protein [Armatimonadetes bacterium]|nr:PEP-CTERM sorting domain-containing protein [Armatimonadota bacterium]